MSDSFVMNAGRGIGKSLDAVAQYLCKDSTYGPLYRYLLGHNGKPEVEIVDENAGLSEDPRQRSSDTAPHAIPRTSTGAITASRSWLIAPASSRIPPPRRG